jgi:hypothetical protein
MAFNVEALALLGLLIEVEAIAIKF